MFASRQEDVAKELARLCRRRGRIGLTTWEPTSTIAKMFAMMKPYMPPPPTPAPPSPFEWGRQERVRELLARDFELKFETGTTVLRMPSGEAVWQVFSDGYGPTKALYQAAGERKDQLHRDTPLSRGKPRANAGSGNGLDECRQTPVQFRHTPTVADCRVSDNCFRSQRHGAPLFTRCPRPAGLQFRPDLEGSRPPKRQSRTRH
jgi:hypothetical protein